VTAHFAVDTIKVVLDGTCGLQGRIVHITFKANTDPGVDSWNGDGDFRFESQTSLTGRLRSKRGDYIPFVLVKQGSASDDRSRLSEMLCHYFPELYPISNKPVQKWLSHIKLRGRRGATEGQRYIDLAQKLRLAVQNEHPAGARNLAELDGAIWRRAVDQGLLES
jgi:hypothetical protein